MGSKNCPETPRQRMIGMMYLVLTAMLALNVSSDVLNAFTTVQQGLTSTIANSNKKNTELYNEIEMAYNLNKQKVAGVREKTTEIRKATAALNDFLEKLKYEMVVLADGEETADVMNIKAKDNLDVGGQVIIHKKKGEELKNMLTAYREKLIGFVAVEDSVLRTAIASHLETKDPKPVDGEFKSWESSTFEGMPLVGVVTVLTMYQTNLLNVEADIVNYLIASIDAESFKFNKLEALVIPESRFLLKGESFKARVLLAAIDTTQRPEIIANRQKLTYKGDVATYTEVANSVGVKKVKGVIHYITPSGVTLPREFEMDYVVADPAVVISLTKMNVFYVGVDNPLTLAIPGIPMDAIDVAITNGTIAEKGDGSYIVKPKVAGKNSSITVLATIQGKKREIETQVYRVKDVPNPIAKINGQSGGKISKNMLVAAGRLDVEMENFDFDLKFTVENFRISTVVEGYVRDATKSNKRKFSAEQLKMIKSLKRNQVLVIEKIMVKAPDGSTRELPPISFRID